jgi:hypothetical protein
MVLLLPPPSVTGRIEAYDGYNGGSDAERTGGRRNRCLSLRPVGGVGADTETERGVVLTAGWCSSPRSDGGCEWDGAAGGVELAGARCCWCWRALASVPVPLWTTVVAVPLLVLVCDA